MLLTGPFGGLTDDVREFLRCLDGDGPDGLALARRRTTLLAAAAAMSGPEPRPPWPTPPATDRSTRVPVAPRW